MKKEIRSSSSPSSAMPFAAAALMRSSPSRAASCDFARGDVSFCTILSSASPIELRRRRRVFVFVLSAAAQDKLLN